MSRIILDRYPDGSEHFTIGWDHACGGGFWQEWATDQEIADAEERLAAWESNPESGPEPFRDGVLVETGIKREGGMWPGIPLADFLDSLPEDLRPLVTDEVMSLLREHAADPDSGYGKAPIDLTGK